MVGRAPPPPPPQRRWRPIILIIMVVAILATTALVMHAQQSAPRPGTISASIAPAAQPTIYKASIEIGFDAITGAPLTMELQAGTPDELQTRVDETQAFIAARRAEGCVPVPLDEGGFAWLPTEIVAQQAAASKALQAKVDANNRAFVEDGKRRQAELEASLAAQGAESARLNAELQANADALQAKQEAAQRHVTGEIAVLEAEMRQIMDGLIASAGNPRDEATTRMLIVTCQQGVHNEQGRKVTFEDRVRGAGFADRWPRFERYLACVHRHDHLQSHGVEERLRAMSPSDGTAPVQASDNRPMVWRDDSPTEQRTLTYDGPGEVLPSGDVKLGGSINTIEKKQRTASRRPPVIPDPIGLGERLVLIDVLVERFGEQRAGLINEKQMSYSDLVELYWAKVYLSGKPSPYPETPQTP